MNNARSNGDGMVEPMSFVVLCDFDGTIVTIDTAEYVLDKFVKEDWRAIDVQLERGEITFEESLEREFAMLKVPEKAMLEALEPVTYFRPNFEMMVRYCKENHFPLIVVSGGLEFSLRHFLGLRGWLGDLEIYGPKAQCTGDGVSVTFPDLFDQASTNFKDDLVKYYRNQGQKVVYVGNGFGDFPAAKIADLAFAIEGSRLAELCKMGGISFREITDFQDVVDSIRDNVLHHG
jgi:2-hydroxy-3-keto-5-methylthiopentenyl-1-phosphate phosphatase